MISTESISIRLGDEYDDVLRAALVSVLLSRGAVGAGSSWGVGGSQELDTARVKIGEEVITIESETYMGLTIEGPKLVVEALAKEISERLDVRK
ncbi:MULTISPECIES: hypothetical protein [Gammaproteobacteria]|uniref:hypothetical protein n=1 Tax=Gammaproteobacteria TaxID=1236 RepID=UPI0019145D29|nr:MULTISPECIES: hypothetical protein [Gammaproteobacteria]MBK5301684.1 hypothetical protein [Bacillus sp. TH86]MBK5321453.1 hypothetical protein [Bacillus sp. TH59]MBK5336403.1 hypothetical protein [Bacillus sp. TH57]MBK5310472.1 hypothetical protein [Pseudomonas sp. TH71]MBK5315951.1 hypothetical protein [Erwinia sp. TH79]